MVICSGVIAQRLWQVHTTWRTPAASHQDTHDHGFGGLPAPYLVLKAIEDYVAVCVHLNINAHPETCRLRRLGEAMLRNGEKACYSVYVESRGAVMDKALQARAHEANTTRTSS